MTFRDPASHLRHHAELSDEEAETEARRLWRSINEVTCASTFFRPASGDADPAQGS